MFSGGQLSGIEIGTGTGIGLGPLISAHRTGLVRQAAVTESTNKPAESVKLSGF